MLKLLFSLFWHGFTFFFLMCLGINGAYRNIKSAMVDQGHREWNDGKKIPYYYIKDTESFYHNKLFGVIFPTTIRNFFFCLGTKVWIDAVAESVGVFTYAAYGLYNASMPPKNSILFGCQTLCQIILTIQGIRLYSPNASLDDMHVDNSSQDEWITFFCLLSIAALVMADQFELEDTRSNNPATEKVVVMILAILQLVFDSGTTYIFGGIVAGLATAYDLKAFFFAPVYLLHILLKMRIGSKINCSVFIFTTTWVQPLGTFLCLIIDTKVFEATSHFLHDTVVKITLILSVIIFVGQCIVEWKEPRCIALSRTTNIAYHKIQQNFPLF